MTGSRDRQVEGIYGERLGTGDPLSRMNGADPKMAVCGTMSGSRVPASTHDEVGYGAVAWIPWGTTGSTAARCILYA